MRALWFALSLSLISVTAQGNDDIELSMSGFTYYTFMSNEDMEESSGKINANFNVRLSDILVSTQLSNHPLDPVQRLAVITPLNIASRHEAGVRVGRFNKIDGFFAESVDSPSTSGLAILPQTVYDTRWSTSLSIMDGVQVFNTTFSEGGEFNVYGSLSVGKPMMSEQIDIQGVMLDTDVLVDDIELVGDYDSWAAHLSINLSDRIEWFYEHSQYNAHFERIGEGDNIYEVAAIETMLANEYKLFINRMGLTATPVDRLTLRGEYYTSSFNIEGLDGTGWYVMGDYDLSQGIRLIGGYGENSSNVASKWHNTDTFIGLAKDYEEFFVNSEIHSITGKSFNLSGTDEVSLALTIGYRW